VDPQADRAVEVAAAAAARAGVIVTALTDVAGARLAAELFAAIWGSGPRVPMTGELLRALEHTGNYVSGAWVGDELVGASVAFFGLERGSWNLHSHITGVAPGVQRAGIGFALKQHQRAWALVRDVKEITWTFDPLVRRNAWFNLVKLGAVAVSYHRDFYGPLQDGINAGDPSDRCLVRWRFAAPEVVAASEVWLADPCEVDGLIHAAVTLIHEDSNGNPVVVEGRRLEGPGPFGCQVPADIEGLRSSSPARARAWRQALQSTLGAAMTAGYVAGGITRDGWYVMTRPPNEDAPG
jgi:predicted GNAT superfamily acetyltransferase